MKNSLTLLPRPNEPREFMQYIPYNLKRTSDWKRLVFGENCPMMHKILTYYPIKKYRKLGPKAYGKIAW